MISTEQITEQCYLYEQKSGVKVTPNAQELLRVVLNGIEEDPHPNWKYDGKKELEARTKNYIQDLPKILDQAFLYCRRIDPQIEKRRLLTTFDLAHQMSTVVSVVCGIRKVPGG